MNRAYAQLEIKAADEPGAKRAFSGIASTISADRMGDIVLPKGAKFKLPIPLLWQHRHSEPIGWVTEAKVTSTGIEIKGEVADVPEDGTLKLRLDEAWQSMKYKLVRGLSIGFNPIKYARIAETYSYEYQEWEWLELSAVTVPANSDASIQSIKSADEAIRRAALGNSGPRIVRLSAEDISKSNPGVSGANDPRLPGVVYLK